MNFFGPKSGLKSGLENMKRLLDNLIRTKKDRSRSVK